MVQYIDIMSLYNCTELVESCHKIYPKLKVTKEFAPYISAEKIHWQYCWMELWWGAESEFTVYLCHKFLWYSDTFLRSETFMYVSFQTKFATKAGQIRDKADHIYNRFKVSIYILFYWAYRILKKVVNVMLELLCVFLF
jgi:hypothetical protein